MNQIHEQGTSGGRTLQRKGRRDDAIPKWVANQGQRGQWGLPQGQLDSHRQRNCREMACREDGQGVPGTGHQTQGKIYANGGQHKCTLQGTDREVCMEGDQWCRVQCMGNYICTKEGLVYKVQCTDCTKCTAHSGVFLSLSGHSLNVKSKHQIAASLGILMHQLQLLFSIFGATLDINNKSKVVSNDKKTSENICQLPKSAVSSWHKLLFRFVGPNLYINCQILT